MAKKRKSNKNHGIITAVILAAIVVGIYAANHFGVFDKNKFITVSESSSEISPLEVHYINVGQGDCSLIISEDKAILIDTGEKENGELICGYLQEHNIESLDCLLLTHPHSDHMGAASYIIDNVDVKQVIIPKVSDDMTPTTKFYEKFLKSVQQKGLKITAAKPGLMVDAGGGASLKVIAPVKDYKDLNNYSAASILTHGNDKFMFTGDIEEEAEQDISDEGYFEDIDVLKVAHHGSSSSSSDFFLETTSPEYAIIMCDGHSYGHPHEETIEKLSEYTDNIYRTDLDGTVIIKSDENGISVTTEK